MPSTAAYGDNVTIKVTASGGASTPTGDVKFAWSDASGAHPIQTVTLVAGVASTSIATLLGQSAPYTITADYGGDGSHSGSTATGSLTITPKPTTLTIATNRPAGVPDGSAYGESVALTATVVRTSPGGAGAPAGTVTFYDGGIGTPPLGTFKLLGSTATLNIASLIVGNHNIVGVFTPTAGQIALNWGSSTNGPAPLVQKVRQAATKAVAITSNTPAGTGAPVTFSVNVGPLLPGAEPSGGFTVAAGASVMFKDGATNLGPGVPGSGSTWTFMTSTLAVGLHTITAEYGGNASFAASISNAVAQSVEAGVSSIKLTATKSPTTFGEAATFTADVMKPGVTTPTGNVVFTDGPRTLGSIALVGGSASVTVADLAAGPHAIQAQYETATATLPHSVLVAPTTTKLTSSINPAALGETTTLTATVKTPGGAIPTGSVLFKDNWTTIATVVLDATGKATTTLAGTTGGTHPLVAEYSGDTSLQASADSLSHVVNRAKSKLELASTPNPSRVGAAVTFTATVSALAPATAIPTGTVVFKEATTVLATVLLGANGSAVFTTTDLTDGKHIIDASFAETTDFEASSATLEQTVSVDATEISVTSSPNPSKFGVPVKITATLGGATAVPTGTVTFKTGTTTLGTGTVDGTGHADLTTSSLPFGTTSVIAEYEGDAASLKGSATTQHLVEKGLSSIAVESSANPAIVGASLSFTATVLAGGAAANGDVEFMDGSLSLGIVPIAGGAATLTTSTLSLGTHAISAKYLGSAQLEVSSSSVLTQSILAAAATPDAGAPPPTPTPPPAAGGSTPDGGLLPPTLDIGAPDGASDDCAMSRGPVKRGLGGAGMLVVLGLLALRRRRSTSR